MEFSFIPSREVATALQTSFRQQLKASYIDMLEQLRGAGVEGISEITIDALMAVPASGMNGLFSFVYHRSIELLEESRFAEVGKLFDLLVEGRYDTLPKFLPADRIDAALFSDILSGISKGTTHKEIRLWAVEPRLEGHAAERIKSGMEKLYKALPDLAFEIDTLVGSVMFFESGGDTTERATSLTGNTFQSLILINAVMEPDWIFLLDKFIHEAAHTYLFAMNRQEELVTNTDGPCYQSPLRRDARDMAAIYHATFVIHRLIYAFNNILKKVRIEESDSKKISRLIEYYQSRLDSGFDTVMEHGELSPLGVRLIREGQDHAVSLRPVLASGDSVLA